MTASARRLAIAVAAVTAVVVASAAAPDAADARHARHKHLVRIIAPPPPPETGYYGQFPLVLDYAQAQAWSLQEPYYRVLLYDYCDYRNCVLGPDGTPRWYGPPG